MTVIFDSGYKEKVFFMWYNKGRPLTIDLYNMIPPDDVHGNTKPTQSTLDRWIKEDFRPRASELDNQVSEQLETRLIQEKIAMLQRHADLGLTMQNIAVEYIQEHKDELTSNSAVRLLVEGVRIERESRGIPAALEKMMNKTDEELVEEIEKLIAESPLLPEEL